MMGVLFQLKETEIRAVATDGHRLVRTINRIVRIAEIQERNCHTVKSFGARGEACRAGKK